jgi:branched-chain amino acid transport system ATP-binding protein
MTTPTKTSADTVTETRRTVVHVDKVTAGYLPGINILNECSLTALDGELIGIIGPNGAS